MASALGKGLSGGLSGAGSGAAIGSVIPGLGTLAGGIIGGLGGLFSGASGGDDQSPEELARKLKEERDRNKGIQYGYLDSMKAPTQTPEMQARIKALQDQSAPTSLVQDPYFQAQRAQVVQGGAQALAGVQNIDRGHNISGGFSNAGSANDIYDRLSGQLSQLGQNSANLKDSKSQQAAQMQQNFADAQSNFANAQIQAKMAIEAGDSTAAYAAIQAAFTAKQTMQENDQKMVATALGGVSSLAGGLGGNKALGDLLGKKDSGSESPIDYSQPDSATNPYGTVGVKKPAQPLPYSMTRLK